MKMRRPRQEVRTYSKEMFGVAETAVRQSPNEQLAPEVKTGLLNTKQGYEGGMMGDRIPNYTSFLAAVKRCWPELGDEFKIAPPFRAEAIDRIRSSMRDLLGGDDNDRAAVAYAGGLSHLYNMAWLEPEMIKATVEEYQKNLLLLLQSEFYMGRFSYALKLACILQLGLPESRKKTDEIFQSQIAELAAFVKKSKAWFIGGLARLLITDFTVEVPTEMQAAALSSNKRELLRLAQATNYGETSKLNQQLDEVFGLGVLLADEAKLRAGGTVQFIYADKPEKQKPLPERSLT